MQLCLKILVFNGQDLKVSFEVLFRMRKDLLLIFENLHFLPQRLALSLQGQDVLIFPFLILLADADDVIDLLQDSVRLGTISNQTPEGVQFLFENVTFHHFT